jgi:hypothetical protein
MPFTRAAIASVWLITLGVFALSGSGLIAGRWGVLLLTLCAVSAPAIVLTYFPKVFAGKE